MLGFVLKGCVHFQLLQLRFCEDQRVEEVRRLLQSSRPVRVALTQKPEVSDHDFIEEQQRHLYTISIRTMALPLGRYVYSVVQFKYPLYEVYSLNTPFQLITVAPRYPFLCR